LNAELKSLPPMAVGEEILGAGARAGAGAGAEADGVDDQPPKSSELNKSAGIFVAGIEIGAAVAFVARAGAGVDVGKDCWANAKSSPLLGLRAG
jgi:hypothetical protein